MIRNILELVKNDLAIAFKNRSVYLILLVPLFAVLVLKLADQSSGAFQPMRLGIIRNENYPSAIIKSIGSAGRTFTVTAVKGRDEGNIMLSERRLDGILTKTKNGTNTLELIVLKKDSLRTLAIVSVLAELQRSSETRSSSWITDIKALRKGGIQKDALPTWILMSVLLVGFIIMPAQVAEEKEKKLLLGLLQTPMLESEWVLAKVFLAMILTFVAVLLLHALGGFDLGNLPSYFVFLGAGGFCFGSFGIFLGFLCANQASARTLGVLFYLPFMLPAALSDFSPNLSVIAQIFPSYRFYVPVKSILLENSNISSFPIELIFLLFVGALGCLISIRLMKKRWLM